MTTTARDHAASKMRHIRDLLERLKHAHYCYYGCDDVPEDSVDGDYHDEDEALEAIQEMPLKVEVRSDWHAPGDADPPMEYQILLTTGGPGVRITGDLGDRTREPVTACLEYKDWGTAWQTCHVDERVLLDFAAHFFE